MKSKISLFFSIIAIVLMGCKPDPVDTTGSLSGTIRDAIDNSPLQGASVTLSPSGRTSVTGNDGHYQFRDVEMGSYTVSVSKGDYESTSQSATVQVGQNTMLDFTLRRASSVLIVSPLTLDFGDTDTNLSFDIQNTGQATMKWQVTENVEWLVCTPTSGEILAGQKGSVAVTVARTGLSMGSYTNTLTVTSGDGGSQTIRVTMNVDSNNPNLPTVSLISVDGVTDVAATFRGEIISIANSRVTAHGFCWSTTTNPSLENGEHKDMGVAESSKSFVYSAANLKPNQHYFVRAYATNAAGTVYSSKQLDFTTTSVQGKPMVETGAVSELAANSVKVSGTVTDLGCVEGITQYGHVWSDVPGEPAYVEGSKTQTEMGEMKQTNSFTSTLTGLLPNTTYYVRAYARNKYGTSYGELLSLTTLRSAVKLATISVKDITHNEATCGGRISDKGGHTIIERGVCWSTSSNPTVDYAHVASTDNSDDFSVRLTNLTETTAYYARAYVKTESGDIFYGQQTTFQTTKEIRFPEVSNTTITEVKPFSVKVSASVTDNGGGRISDAGFCYSTSPSPTILDNKKSCGHPTANFSTTISNLMENTRYYIRAYVTNERGTNYGEQVEVTTLEVSLPMLSTVTVSNVTFKAATFNANVTSLGNGTLKNSGFCLSTNHHPTIENTILSCQANQNLTASTTSLSAETTYYVRAFAENEKGIAYSEEQSFTTTDGGNIQLEGWNEDKNWN